MTDDDIVTEVTEAEFLTAARAALARLGLTYAELEDQARRRDFTSAQAHSLWVSIGEAVDPALFDTTADPEQPCTNASPPRKSPAPSPPADTPTP